jgi:RimJ/RimL family protein N-acetyltransferase
MRQEGLLVSSFQNHQAEWRDHHVYAIVESEWNAGDRNA